MKAPNHYSGRRIQCISCGKVLRVPDDGAAETTPPPPAKPKVASSPPAPPPRPAAPPPAPAKEMPVAKEVPLAAPISPPRAKAPDPEPEPVRESTAPVAVAPPAAPVPLAAPVPRTAAPQPGFVYFHDALGNTFKARAEHAGEPVRSPHTGEILFVPRQSTAGAPATSARRVSDVTEEVEPEDDAPRSRSGKGSSAKLWLAITLILGIAAGIAVGVWFYFQLEKPSSSNNQQVEQQHPQIPVPGPGPGPRPPGRDAFGTPDKDAGTPGKPPIGIKLPPPAPPGEQDEELVKSALALVPPDATGFVSMRIADQLRGERGKVARELLQQQSPQIAMIEEKLGVKIEDVERVIFVASEPKPETAWVIVALRKPIDPQKVLELTGQKEEEHSGKKYAPAVDPNQSPALHFASKQLVVLGGDEGVKKFLDYKPGETKPLEKALELAAKNHHLTAGGQVPADLVKGFTPQLPDQAKPFLPILELNSATLTADFGKDYVFDVGLWYPDDAKAKAGQEATQKGLDLVKGLITLAMLGQPNTPEGKQTRELMQKASDLLGSIKPEQQGKVVQLRIKIDDAEATLAPALLEATQRVRGAAESVQSSNNLKQMALACHNWHATYGHWPQPAIYGKDGKPLLSWRVALLPYMEQDQLYKQFKLDEPWDSEHNKKLIPLMPKVYEIPSTIKPGQTFYQVFTGPETAFPLDATKKLRLPASFTDGTSNTLAIVEAAKAVPWTKPEDIPLTEQLDASKLLGNHHGRGTFLAAFCDGTVRPLPLKLDAKILRALITPNGGETIPPNFDK
jgi:hypothetical protein